MNTKVFKGMAVLFGASFLMIAMGVAVANGKNDTRTRFVDCADGDTIADALRRARPGRPLLVNIEGTCQEYVEIIVDDVTLRGGTLIGGIDVLSARRVTIENMTVKNGSRDGVAALNGAFVTLLNLRIDNHARDGVNISQGSTAIMEGNRVTNNGRYGLLVSETSSARLKDNPLIQSNVVNAPRTRTDPFSATTLGVFHASFVRLLGGNRIVNDGGPGGIAVEVFHLAELRQQFGFDRIEGDRAISVGNVSTAELRGEFEVTGQVRLFLHSTLRLSKRFGPMAVVDGDIRPDGDSAVSFSLFTLADGTVFGPVRVTGALICGDSESSAELRSGLTPADIFDGGDAAFNCTGLNQEEVLPPPGP